MTFHRILSDKRDAYILGVDVGGTAIKAALYKINDSNLGEPIPLFSEDEKKNGNDASQRGMLGHLKQMKEVFSKAADKVKAINGTLVGVGVGMPGRFNDKGFIFKNTCTQLDEPDDKMYGIEFKKAYKDALHDVCKSAYLSLEVANDADMMIQGMIQSLHHGEAFATDQNGNALPLDQTSQIGLFGIGTGVGHTIVIHNVANGNHHIEHVTDGHASKLLIDVDPKDIEIIEQIKAQGVEVQESGGKFRAEDLFKEGTIKAIAGINHAMDADFQNPRHDKAVRFAGKYMARTIEAIASGNNEDINPEQGWSDEAKRLAAQTQIYLVGGRPAKGYLDDNGVEDIERGQLGKHIIQYAVEELSKRADAYRASGDNAFADKLSAIKLAQYVGPEIAEKASAAAALQTYLEHEANRAINRAAFR